jgi:hypothetical protein
LTAIGATLAGGPSWIALESWILPFDHWAAKGCLSAAVS